MEERIKAIEAAMIQTQHQQRIMAEMIDKQWEAVDQIIKEVTKLKDKILMLENDIYKNGHNS
jgi:uncharacterized coiled-coil protein SlyX